MAVLFIILSEAAQGAARQGGHKSIRDKLLTPEKQTASDCAHASERNRIRQERKWKMYAVGTDPGSDRTPHRSCQRIVVYSARNRD